MDNDRLIELEVKLSVAHSRMVSAKHRLIDADNFSIADDAATAFRLYHTLKWRYTAMIYDATGEYPLKLHSRLGLR